MIIEPAFRREPERLAARHGLSFHIELGHVTTHAGYKSETRPATEEEMELWTALTQPDDTGYLPATWKEIYDTLGYRTGHATISPIDFQQVIRHATKETWEPITDADTLRAGYFGILKHTTGYGSHIHVSRAIPCGYFYPGRDEKLYIPNEGESVPEELARRVALDLKPLMVSP